MSYKTFIWNQTKKKKNPTRSHRKFQVFQSVTICIVDYSEVGRLGVTFFSSLQSQIFTSFCTEPDEGVMASSSRYIRQVTDANWFHFSESNIFKGNFWFMGSSDFYSHCLHRLEADRLNRLPKSTQLEAHALLVHCSLPTLYHGLLSLSLKMDLFSVYFGD